MSLGKNLCNAMKEAWEIKKLGDLATFVNGYAFKPIDWCEEGIPIIRIQNLNNSQADYNYSQQDLPDKYVVLQNDTLISWSASLGVYVWKGVKSYLNQHIFKVVFNKGNIDKAFFRYAVNSRLKEMEKNTHGATMKHIVKKDFDNTKIILPPISEQTRIVEELDLLNGILDKKRQQLKELDALSQSIFYDMFGDPIANEKGWEINNFDEFGEVIGGYAFKSSNYKESGIPILKIGNINSGEFKNDPIDYYEYDLKLSRYEIKPNDIVISLTGTVGKGDYGNVCILPNTYDLYYLNQRNAKLETNGFCNNIYLKYLFIDKGIKYILTGNSRGVRQANISNNDIYNLPIPVPPISLQTEFANKIKSIEHQKELIKQSIAETQTLLDSRMDYYFN